MNAVSLYLFGSRNVDEFALSSFAVSFRCTALAAEAIRVPFGCQLAVGAFDLTSSGSPTHAEYEYAHSNATVPWKQEVKSVV